MRNSIASRLRLTPQQREARVWILDISLGDLFHSHYYGVEKIAKRDIEDPNAGHRNAGVNRKREALELRIWRATRKRAR